MEVSDQAPGLSRHQAEAIGEKEDTIEGRSKAGLGGI
jgi:hypothetical protein